MKLLLILFLIYFTAFTYCDRPYMFEPANNHYKLNDGDYFHIGFSEIENATDFDHCYYEAQGFSGDYVVNKTISNSLSISDFFERDTLGQQTTCRVSVTTIDDQTPLLWVITAHDKMSGQNFSEEVTVDFYYNIKTLTDSTRVLIGTDVFNYLLVPPGETKFEKCFISIDNGDEIDIGFNSTLISFPDNFNNSDNLKHRLSALGRGQCGYKLTEAQKTDSEHDVFLIASTNNKTYRSRADIQVFPIETEDNNAINRTIFSKLGFSLNLECASNSPTLSQQTFCILFNPKGELVFEGVICTYNLDVVTMEDFGVWSCSVGFQHSMEPLRFFTEVKQEKPEKSVDVFLKEDQQNGLLVLGCELRDTSKAAVLCKFQRPDGEVVMAYDGGAAGRYTAMETNLKTCKCGIEIEKPLLTEEKGVWKCEIFVSFGEDSAGSFINVPSDKSLLSPGVSLQQETTINVKLTSPFTINCKVSYPSENCFITSPNGTIFNTQYPLKLTMGQCLLDIDSAEVSHNGSWSCFFDRENGLEDEEVRVEVSIIENKIVYADSSVLKGEKAQLYCNTAGIPLEYCRFKSPNNRIYSLRNGVSKTNELGYYGRGLEFGDCGIEIERADESTAGQWTCQIGKIGSSAKNDIKKELTLSVEAQGLDQAESIGISLGVIAAAVCILGFIGYRYYTYRRRRINQNLANQTGDNISHGSGENIILETQQRNNYNTSLQ